MNIFSAKDIKRFDNWTVLIYSEPGKGKTKGTGKLIIIKNQHPGEYVAQRK